MYLGALLFCDGEIRGDLADWCVTHGQIIRVARFRRGD